MSDSSDTASTDADRSILRLFASRDLIGIILSIVGAYSSLVFPGRLSMVFAGINGIGAILIFTTDSTDSINTAGYFFVLGSWSLLALSGQTTSVAVPTMLTALWFGFKTERNIWAERVNS